MSVQKDDLETLWTLPKKKEMNRTQQAHLSSKLKALKKQIGKERLQD